MMKWCKNFPSNLFIEHVCIAGINVRELVGGEDFGWLIRTPCISTHKTDIKCDKCEYPSDEEELERKHKADKSFEIVSKAIKQIREITGAEPTFEDSYGTKLGYSGNIKCPACGNTLRFSVAQGNNHVSGECDTEGCLKWMM